MKKHVRNRREFLGLTGFGVAGLASGSFLGATVSAEAQNRDADPRHAELVVFNAKVYTVDRRMPKAEAFAVKGGRFVCVGDAAEAKAFIVKGTRTFDAKQMTIVPGFIDCHNHAPGNTLLYEVIVGNPYEVEFVTIASIIDKLRARAQKTPAGFWVDGYFYDDTKVKDRSQLNVHDLDQVSREHPVVVHHRGGHTSYYNSKAFELSGIDKNTQNPVGGTYDHDENGELNGRVTDRAREVFNKVGQRETFTSEQKEQRDHVARGDPSSGCHPSARSVAARTLVGILRTHPHAKGKKRGDGGKRRYLTVSVPYIFRRNRGFHLDCAFD